MEKTLPRPKLEERLWKSHKSGDFDPTGSAQDG